MKSSISFIVQYFDTKNSPITEYVSLMKEKKRQKKKKQAFIFSFPSGESVWWEQMLKLLNC